MNNLVGRVVYFVMPTGVPRPAAVIHAHDNGVCDLRVFPVPKATDILLLAGGIPSGGGFEKDDSFFVDDVVFDDQAMLPGTWHWIESV